MDTRIAHMVCFELIDASESKIQELVAQVRQYLDDHPGLQFFAVGTLNQELTREVNVRDFHVSLHTVFANRQAHDVYQVSERHVEFIERNKGNWKSVRVFDSNLES